MNLKQILSQRSLFSIITAFLGFSVFFIALILILVGRPVVEKLVAIHLSPQIQTVAYSTQLLSEDASSRQDSKDLEHKLSQFQKNAHLTELTVLSKDQSWQSASRSENTQAASISNLFKEQIQLVQQNQSPFHQLIWFNSKPVFIHIEPLSINQSSRASSVLFIAVNLLDNLSSIFVPGLIFLGVCLGLAVGQTLVIWFIVKKLAITPLQRIEQKLSTNRPPLTKTTPSNYLCRELRVIQDFIDQPTEKITTSLKREHQCAAALNHIQAQLVQKSQALEETKNELEHRVATRTAELTTTLFEMHKMQTNLLSQEQKLKHDALHDRLTGLPNRHYFHQLLNDAIAEYSQDPNCRYSVLYLDLDHFKVVNDSLGHTLGDQFLQLVAQRLQTLLRPNDKIARLGGDEFAILLNDLQRTDHASSLAKRLIQSMRSPFQLNTYEAYSGVSIGITYCNPTYEEPESILRDADIAMYRAKRKGRGQYVIFDNRMKTQAMRRLRLENDLRRAIANQEFQLFYHPIVSIQSNKLTGFEGLARWLHPEEGFISPTEFIPIAEEVGLIHELGIWTLEEGCKQLKKWDKSFTESQGLTISINLSPIQLQQSNLWEKVNDALTQSGLPGYRLKLEITESSILTSPPETLKTLNRFKELGIQLCIDDFGMGHSSLQRLHELPIDILKIDRTFISQIANSHADSEVVRMIMALAHGSNMAVVAEGVEDLQQLDMLKALNCEWGQGFLYAEPMSHIEVEQEFFPKYFTPFEKHLARLHLAS